MSNPRVKRPRIVPPEIRQRAAYSCDRCKTKKIKCIRSDPLNDSVKSQDKSTPCDSCIKSKVACQTSLPRRRRVYGSFENLGIHYQTILTLIQGLYPHIDINDVNKLVELGESMGIKMDPDSNHFQDNDLKTIELENQILKPFIPKVESLKNSLDSTTASQSPINTQKIDTSNNDASNSSYAVSETVIFDSKGGSHYVGSSGTSVLFSVLCNLLQKRSFKQTLSFDRNIKLFRNKLETDDRQNYMIIGELFQKPNFPIISFISKQESFTYFNHFLKFFHPFYFIFDEQKVRANHDAYWQKLENPNEPIELSDADVGCIYLTWILGSRLIDSSMVLPNIMTLNETLRFILTEVCLGSSISSIQFLFLYAINLHANKNRDSAWNLVGLAIRQAISLGLHRRMILKNSKSDLHTQIFWSVYQYELTLCSTFGRPSNINEEEIDIDYPDLSTNPNVTKEFEEYFVSSLKLSRFLNKIVKDRKITSNQQPISLINIERTLSMKNQLIQIHKELKIKKLAEIQSIYDYKLNLRFHYYMVTLILPFLLYIATTNFQVQEDETLLSIMKTGLQSAITVAKLMKISVLRQFNHGASSTDCMYGYSSTLVLSLFFIYLSNGSNDMLELKVEIENELEIIDKRTTLEFISNIIEFMHSSQLDATTKRILEVIEGIKNDLKLVEIQDDLRFDTLNFEGTDQMVYDSLFTSNEIYLDGPVIGLDI